MEQHQISVAFKSLKRRRLEENRHESSTFLDGLNEDLLERILSWLPALSFFQLRSVCKRWNSVATSATFRLACSQIPFREPWFFMVDSDLDQSVIYDTGEGNWKILNRPDILRQHCNSKSIPVASSGGLVCFKNVSGDFIICNPLTGVCRELPSAGLSIRNQTVHGIAMSSSTGSSCSYKLVIVCGEVPNLFTKTYDSNKGFWEQEERLVQKSTNLVDSEIGTDDNVYFLSKAGVVVAADMQRSPSKQYSSVMTTEGDEEVIYFLSPTGAIVACILAQNSFLKYPRLLPIYVEHSIDMVTCMGEMLLVVLSSFLETASLRIWQFSKSTRSWHQVAAMPPAMSHEFYEKKADINCVGCGDKIFVCMNSSELSTCFMYNMAADEWLELPKWFQNGRAMEFMSAFSFEPRVEACP